MIKSISILFSFLCAFLTFAQKPSVELIVQPSNVEVGEQFNVIVKSNITGEINIDFPQTYDQGYNVMNRMEQDYDGNTGELITIYYHARTGSISKEGTYTFGPAYIRKGNKVYRSNKVTVTAKLKAHESNETVEESLFRKPACGSIVLSKCKVYQGEPVVIESKVTARFKPTHYDAYRSYSIETGADQHKLSCPDEIIVRNENKGNKERFIFEMDKQVVFFNTPGRIKIAPFEMTLQSGFDGFEVNSKQNHIRVMPLPNNAPYSFLGGVGEFEISCSFDSQNVKQGEITSCTLIISGKGNLQDIANPKITFPNELKLYGDPERDEKFKFTEKGAEGKIQLKYHVQVLKDGKINFPAIAMAYFDPISEKYVTKYTEPKRLTIEKDPSFVVASNSQAEKSMGGDIERFNSSENENGGFLSSPTLKWIGISTPLCLAFLFLFFRIKKRKDETTSSETLEGEQSAPQVKVNSNEWLSVLQSHADTGNTKPFFTQLSKNLQNSVSQAARGDIDWVLTRDEIKEFFNQKNLPIDFQTDFFGLQQTCELCRYGCQTPDHDLDTYLGKAKEIFIRLEELS